MSIQDTGNTDILLQMDLQPSSMLRRALITSHLLAIFALWWIDAPVLLQLGGTVGLALSCRCSILRMRDINHLHMRPGEILLGRGGQMSAVILQDAPWCNEWLQVLRFSLQTTDPESGAAGTAIGAGSLWQRLVYWYGCSCGRRRLSVVILPDSASAQCRRRLRVLLRWHSFSGGVPAQAGSDSTAGSRGSRMVSFASGSRSG